MNNYFPKKGIGLSKTRQDFVISFQKNHIQGEENYMKSPLPNQNNPKFQFTHSVVKNQNQTPNSWQQNKSIQPIQFESKKSQRHSLIQISSSEPIDKYQSNQETLRPNNWKYVPTNYNIPSKEKPYKNEKSQLNNNSEITAIKIESHSSIKQTQERPKTERISRSLFVQNIKDGQLDSAKASPTRAAYKRQNEERQSENYQINNNKNSQKNGIEQQKLKNVEFQIFESKMAENNLNSKLKLIQPQLEPNLSTKNNESLKQLTVELRVKQEVAKKQFQHQSKIRQLQKAYTVKLDELRSNWQLQKIKLNQTIDEKQKVQKQLEHKLAQKQKQIEERAATFQFQIRKLQSSKKRLENESENNRKLFQYERSRYEKSKQSINKLIFFEDDLIHAKDYDRIKDELIEVMNQNKRLYDQHQLYINQTKEIKYEFQKQRIQLQKSIKNLQQENYGFKLSIQKLTEESEHKMTIIKLQNELNFHKKKNIELGEALIAKEQQYQQLRDQLHELQSIKVKQQKQSNPYTIDQTHLQQINDSLALYESRISNLNDTIAIKNTQIDKQKKMIDLLSVQLRKNRQEKHISNMKQKTNQSHLKNQVESLQRTLQSQLQIYQKKLASSEQTVQRRMKQINDKDKFIKQFLLSRIKSLQSSSVEEVLKTINSYFT